MRLTFRNQNEDNIIISNILFMHDVINILFMHDVTDKGFLLNFRSMNEFLVSVNSK